jgi:hypothetical protein
MSTDYNVGQVVFYHYEKKRTLAVVHKIYYETKELDIYYLDKDFTIHEKKVNIADIRKAIRGSGIIDVMDNKYINDEDHIRKKLIQLSDIHLNNFTEVNGGSRKSKRRKSRHHKKTNRRHKSRRYKKSIRHH